MYIQNVKCGKNHNLKQTHHPPKNIITLTVRITKLLAVNIRKEHHSTDIHKQEKVKQITAEDIPI